MVVFIDRVRAVSRTAMIETLSASPRVGASVVYYSADGHILSEKPEQLPLFDMAPDTRGDL